MAKHKQSTFERLRNGKLPCNRKQRRELERRLNSADPGLEIIHPHAAGIDVGNESHYVAVAAGRDARPVREFGSWTAALEEMAQWLKSCGVETVVIAYASHCTSLGRCETFWNRSLFDSLTPLAFRGGSGPGSSYRYSPFSLHKCPRRSPAARQAVTCFVLMPSRCAISSRVSIPFARNRSKRLLSPYLTLTRPIMRPVNGLP